MKMLLDDFSVNILDANHKIFVLNVTYFPSKEPDLSEFLDVLHPQELEYCNRLIHERRLKSYLYGRISIKNAVTQMKENAVHKNILIKNGVFHQPVLICGDIHNTDVTLAHCDSCAVSMAYCDEYIFGVDIEPLGNERLEHVISKELTEGEKKAIQSLDHNLGMTILWTVKEAVSKCIKTGLTIPLSMLEVNEIRIGAGYYMAKCNNFSQYITNCYILQNKYVLSITHPKTVTINLSL